jgi:hypothetical protein
VKADARTGVIVFTEPALQQWLTNLNQRLASAETGILSLTDRNAQYDIVEEIIQEELKQLPLEEIRRNPEFVQAIISAVELDREYLESRTRAFDEIATGQVATFEYINFREPIKPDTHSFKFIWEKGFWHGMDFTVNASLTLYNRKPTNPDVNRIRDFDLSGQFDIPMRRLDLGILNDSVLSFAGKYQRLNADVIDDLGQIVPGTKGDIALGQAKFTIPIGDTGIKLPFSMTFSNRTELIKEKEVRLSFGFTLDFDSIFTRLKPFNLFRP